jgi:hypothetical protein
VAQQIEREPPTTEPGTPGTPGEPGTPGGGGEEEIFFCKTRTVLSGTPPPTTFCFETLEECQNFTPDPIVDQIITECQREEGLPPGAITP